MGIKNPDILIPKLDDLNNMFQKWNYIASDIVSESEKLQIYSSNSLSQQKQSVEITKNQVQEDSSKIEHVKNEISVLRVKCDNELLESQKLLSETKTLLSTAEITVIYWEKELDKATAWLEKAKERLRQAEIEYENAKIQLQYAIDELDRAEQALSACRSSTSKDKDGNEVEPDCSYEENRVRESEEQVQLATENLKLAEKELNEAREEVLEATECVNFCTEALSLANKTLSNAKLANSFSSRATLKAERSSEEYNSASNSTMMAEQKLISERELIDNANSLIGKAFVKYDESTQNNKEAIYCTDSAQNYSSKGIQDLSIRLDFLRRFASPFNFNRTSHTSKEQLKTSKKNYSNDKPTNISIIENQLDIKGFKAFESNIWDVVEYKKNMTNNKDWSGFYIAEEKSIAKGYLPDAIKDKKGNGLAHIHKVQLNRDVKIILCLDEGLKTGKIDPANVKRALREKGIDVKDEEPLIPRLGELGYLFKCYNNKDGDFEIIIPNNMLDDLKIISSTSYKLNEFKVV